MKRLTVLAHIDSFSGYGQMTLEIITRLEKLARCHISVRPVAVSEMFGAKVPMAIKSRIVNGEQPEEFELLIHPPGFAPTPGKKTVAYSMWESTRPTKGAIEMFNKCAAVVTPSMWNASCFSAAGVDVPIYTVPLGVNPEVFRFRKPKNGGKFVVGVAGRMAHGGVRKGINESIEAFLKAFPDEDDVELHVKCFPDCDVKSVTDPRVKITQKFLSEQQMADWLANLTVFMSLARAEGWGLLQHQAMAIGRPVITVNFGGVTEFIDKNTGLFVPFKFVPAGGMYQGCGHWAEPSQESVVAALRKCQEMQSKHPLASNYCAEVVKHLTWDNTVRKLHEVLIEVGAL